ncbi:MAG: pseudouridine synthase, RluA family [Fibrobacteres bacterium]|nr:pseudouridine synthase, RluA family [Fibrobacterota bacterium]
MNSISPRASTVFVPCGIPVDSTLLDFLSERFPHIGAETWESRIGEGKVRFGDGTAAFALSKVGPGMEIRYFREVSAEPRKFEAHQILYRDDHILVACKPHFLPVVPGGKFVRECLLYHLMEETGLSGLTPVHRIDRHTAGLVLFSIHENERGRYHNLFKERQVEKEYLANVGWLSGPPAEDSWELGGRIEKYGPYLRCHLAEGVPNAFCRISLLERSGAYAGLALYPFTGKRHQLRLQVSQIGAAILHDPYYPDLLPEVPDDPARPLQLLSKSLRFRDPFTQRERAFTSPRVLLPLPGD